MPKRLRAVLAVSALVSCVALSDANALPRVMAPGSMPGPPAETAKVGALFSGDLDGGHFCTASVVHSEDRNLIATAGHCLGDGEDVVFAPGYHDGEAPYGLWQLDQVYEDDAWTNDEDEDHDLAFATLKPLDGEQIEDVTGASTLDTSGSTGHEVTVTGYPSSEDAARTCTTTPTLFRSGQQRVDCPDFTTGTSGSPWLTDDGKLTGVLGGYEGGGDSPDVSYSVVLGEQAADLYAKATAG
ncbi:trypsin-like serine peptidase [Streptomyces monticola]|uniref:Trypsin-like serine peptidase n=1 Tax=Streptomyces monticola TaxID=2666263 RepID=A0ABW2JWX1_9ACTN